MKQVRQRVDVIRQENDKKGDELYQSLVRQMKDFREQKGISLTALSVKTQTYASYIQRVESAKINTSVKKLVILLDALGLELVIQQKKDKNKD